MTKGNITNQDTDAAGAQATLGVSENQWTHGSAKATVSAAFSCELAETEAIASRAAAITARLEEALEFHGTKARATYEPAVSAEVAEITAIVSRIREIKLRLDEARECYSSEEERLNAKIHSFNKAADNCEAHAVRCDEATLRDEACAWRRSEISYREAAAASTPQGDGFYVSQLFDGMADYSMSLLDCSESAIQLAYDGCTVESYYYDEDMTITEALYYVAKGIERLLSYVRWISDLPGAAHDQGTENLCLYQEFIASRRSGASTRELFVPVYYADDFTTLHRCVKRMMQLVETIDQKMSA